MTDAPGGATPDRTATLDVIPPSDDDRAIVARMAAGDPRALGELYDRWSAVARALAWRILGDGDEAEDVVEETFWQLWRQAARFNAARGTVATWIATVARSRALDRRRALNRRRDTTQLDVTRETPPNAPIVDRDSGAVDPSSAVEAQERRTLVATALMELPAEQREAVELAYFEGLSQSDIAEQTGEPLGTIKTRIRLAMQKLRSRLSALRAEGM